MPLPLYSPTINLLAVGYGVQGTWEDIDVSAVYDEAAQRFGHHQQGFKETLKQYAVPRYMVLAVVHDCRLRKVLACL